MNAPTRAEWLARRRSGLGGSDIGAIFGLSPFRTAVDVWLSKTGREPDDDLAANRRDIRFGLYGEQFVAAEYCLSTGRRVQRYNTMLRHESAPLLANVDRLVIPEGAKIAAHRGEIRTDRGLECKTANQFAAFDSDAWGASETDEVPPAYLLQAEVYLLLTGCAVWDLACLFGNGARDTDFRIYTIRKDADLQREIVARATEWWKRHVIGDAAPEPVSDADVCKLFPRSSARVAQADALVRDDWARLRKVREEIKSLEADEEPLIVRLKAALGEADTLSDGQQVLATWKSAKDLKVVDWESVARSAPIEAAALDALIAQNTTIRAGSRRFLLKDPK